MTTPAQAKQALRREILRRRAEAAAAPPEVRAERDRLVTGRILEYLSSAFGPDPLVCAFVPSHGEIGGPGLPSALAAAGARVLLPVSPTDGPLDWAPHSGDAGLVPGRFGIPVPDTTPLGPGEIARVDLVILPAVAVDRRGHRLGRGGGYYDRSLEFLTGATPRRPRLMALVDSHEVVDHVPVEAHDLPVDLVVTPTETFVTDT